MKNFLFPAALLLLHTILSAQVPARNNNAQPVVVTNKIPESAELALLKQEIINLKAQFDIKVKEVTDLANLIKQKINEYQKKKGVLNFNISEANADFSNSQGEASNALKKLKDALESMINKI